MTFWQRLVCTVFISYVLVVAVVLLFSSYLPLYLSVPVNTCAGWCVGNSVLWLLGPWVKEGS